MFAPHVQLSCAHGCSVLNHSLSKSNFAESRKVFHLQRCSVLCRWEERWSQKSSRQSNCKCTSFITSMSDVTKREYSAVCSFMYMIRVKNICHLSVSPDCFSAIRQTHTIQVKVLVKLQRDRLSAHTPSYSALLRARFCMCSHASSYAILHRSCDAKPRSQDTRSCGHHWRSAKRFLLGYTRH